MSASIGPAVALTLTGPDDLTDIQDLLDLAHEYDHAEFGILFSTIRMGTPRYPSAEWVKKLTEADVEFIHLSAHFCGQYARDTLAGDFRWVESLPKQFKRIQLNGFDPFNPSHAVNVVHMAKSYPFTVILQARNEKALVESARIASTVDFREGRLVVLYDPSGGKGLEPQTWPQSPTGATIGFAGGINPNNVREILKALCDRPSFWIDMESGIRTDEVFDFAKCRQVLAAQVEHWNNGWGTADGK